MSNDGDLNNMWNEATQGIANIDPGKQASCFLILLDWMANTSCLLADIPVETRPARS